MTEQASSSGSNLVLEGMKIPCPACLEPMHMAASRCPHCHKEFSRDEVKTNVASRRSTSMVGCATILAAAALLAYLVWSVASCSQSAKVPTSGPMDDGTRLTWEEVAKDMVRKELRDPDSAQFSDVRVIEASSELPKAICGKINSRNGFGGMAGWQRFIVTETAIIETPQLEHEFSMTWISLCI
jgi:hypothetical protein